MDIRKVKKLMELLEQSGMNEIEIHEGKESVRISRHDKAPIMPVSAPVSTPAAKPIAIEAAAPAVTIHPITSPMVGTFYASASPTSEPFVKVGQHVNQGDSVCIVEAMKIMNQIEADQSGVVTEILCDDGEAVEFGQTLVTIK